MAASCPRWREDLGAWATGSLDGPEADALLAHLAECDGCSEEAGRLTEVVAALDVADPSPSGSTRSDPPEALADLVVSRLAAERTRPAHRPRLAAALATAAAVVLVVAVAAVAWWPTDGAPPERVAVALSRVADPLDATVEVEGKQWGTLVHIEASGFKDGQAYRVWVEDHDGTRHPAGTFLGIGDREMTCYMAAATPLAEAVAVGVDDMDGEPVLRGNVGEPSHRESAASP